MIRKPLLSLLLLIPSASAFALGLGAIQVDSALNEPLAARVKLISADGMPIEDIRVRLAGPDEFKRAGVERPFLLSRLRFEPVIPESGEAYIQVSTRETVREPFLDFLLEVSWPQGSLIRGFTVLLDPPTYQPPQLAATAAPAERPRPISSPRSPDRTSYGPVQRTETLWLIAGKLQPEAGVSRNRIMIALLRSNPEAFQQGNINLLKQGSRLTIPSPAEMASISESEARAAVRRQMAEWRAGRRAETPAAAQQSRVERPLATEPATPVQKSASPVDQPAPPAVAEEISETRAPVAPAVTAPELTEAERQRLRVVEPDRNWQVAEKSEPDYPVQESEKLREAIRDSEQELVAVQEINRDIVELRAALESKVEALRKALAEKDAQLEDLRQQIAQASDSASNVEGDATPDSPVAGTAAVSPPGNVTVAAPVVEPASPASVWKDEYWMMLMGAVIVVLSILLLLSRRGARRAPAFEKPELFEMSSDAAVSDRAGPARPAVGRDESIAAPETPLRVPSEEGGVYAAGVPAEGGPAETRYDVASVLMEADIYLAYRRYSQAESLVEEAMAEHPESQELKAKLLEIYAFRRDKQAFTRYLDEVHPLMMIRAPDLWEKVVEMGRPLVPEHPAWPVDDGADVVLPSTAETPAQAPDKVSPADPFDLEIDLEDLEIPGGDNEPVGFDDVIKKKEYQPGEEDIPSIDIDVDLDFDNLDELPKDK